MSLSRVNKMKTMRTKFLSFLHNTKGIAAVEFALVLPIFMTLVFGAYGLYFMMKNGDSVDRSTAVIADLVSRELNMTDAKLNRFINVSKALSGSVGNDDTYKIIITSVFNEFDSDGDDELTIRWSLSNKIDEKIELSDLEDLDIPSIAEGDSIIIVTTEVDYEPFFLKGIVDEVVTFDGYAVRRPRFVPLLTYTP